MKDIPIYDFLGTLNLRSQNAFYAQLHYLKTTFPNKPVIVTLGDLLKEPYNGLLKIPNFGKKSLTELMVVLKSLAVSNGIMTYQEIIKSGYDFNFYSLLQNKLQDQDNVVSGSTVTVYGKYLEIYAQIEAIKAEIEGMRIMNQERLNNNFAAAYDQSHFDEKAEELRNLGAEALKY